MSEAPGTPHSFGGNPGEPVPEVDPDDIKTLWQQTHDLQARNPGQNVAIRIDLVKTTLKPGANAEAVFYRSSMIFLSRGSKLATKCFPRNMSSGKLEYKSSVIVTVNGTDSNPVKVFLKSKPEPK